MVTRQASEIPERNYKSNLVSKRNNVREIATIVAKPKHPGIPVNKTNVRVCTLVRSWRQLQYHKYVMQLEQEISREKRKRNYKDKTSAYSSTAAHERYEFTYRYSSRTFAVFASSTIKQKSAEGEGVRTQATNQTRAMSRPGRHSSLLMSRSSGGDNPQIVSRGRNIWEGRGSSSSSRRHYLKPVWVAQYLPLRAPNS